MTHPLIPFADPRAAYLERASAINDAVRRVFESGMYIMGAEVEAFEQEFAAWLGADTVGTPLHAVGVANGTDALELALRGHFSLRELAKTEINRSAVFTVSHTAVATVSAIERAGAVPVLVDVDSFSGTMDERALAQALQKAVAAGLSPAAVVPVHIYGHPCHMEALMAVAQEAGLFVLEDCAQAHGARYQGRLAGTWGHTAAFSCYPTKNLGALGDAGVVTTPNAALAAEMKALRQYGWKERYVSAVTGINSRLDPVQAAVLRINLTYLDQDVARRRRIAGMYSAALAPAAVKIPQCATWAEHAWHLYVVRVSGGVARRDALLTHLRQHGVGASLHYPQAVHQQPAYAGKFLECPCGLPATTGLYEQILTLPLYPQMTDAQVARVVDAVLAWRG